MSGGVDSSVAAALLKREVHDVTGLTMKIWPGGGASGKAKRHGCYGPGDVEDIADAESVANQLGIPHHVIDLTEEYKSEVLDFFCDQYLAGRTPNPCVRCNQRVKFGALLEKALESGIDFERFATGHHARVECDGASGRYLLMKGKDPRKDQSYFLAKLSQAQLARVMFPLGGFTKERVRQMAAEFGLEVAEKPESQDFAEGGHISLFATPAAPGPIVDRKGKVLGQHHGITHYTVGQRKGLGISSEKPVYVVAIDAAMNTVFVGEKSEVYSSEFRVSDVNWVSVPEPEEAITARVRIRYRHAEAEAEVTPLPGGGAQVSFREPQLAITPGQTAVFYDGDLVLGGGSIDATVRA